MRINPARTTAYNIQIEAKIQTWLRQARNRDGGRKRRYQAAARRDSNKKSRLSMDDEIEKQYLKDSIRSHSHVDD